MIYSQKRQFLFTSILVIGTAATILIHYFIRNKIYQDYLQIDFFFFTFIPFLICFIFYWLNNKIPEFIFDENYIQVFEKSKVQKFTKQEIEQIVYFVTNVKNKKTENLVIITNNQERYRLTDSDYKNFNEIKYFLQQNYQIDSYELNETPDVRVVLSFILFFILIISIMSFDNGDKTKGLKRIQVILLSKPEIHFGGSKSSTDEIEFKFHELEKFSTSFLYKKENKNYVEATLASFHVNDTLIIEIPKSYYDKKIAKTQALTFFDKHFNYDEMPMYYISNKDSSNKLIKQYP